MNIKFIDQEYQFKALERIFIDLKHKFKDYEYKIHHYRKEINKEIKNYKFKSNGKLRFTGAS